MLLLNDEQKIFIEKHQIPFSVIFDATGITKKKYEISMKENETYYAFGAGDCSRVGHDNKPLKSRHGKCVMCKTPTGGFSLNICKKGYENIEAYTYIAASQTGKKMKIGITVNIEKRLNQIKEEEYAGFQGWEIIYYIKSNKANKLENETLKNTKLYKCSGKYYKNGKLRDNYEARSCNYKTIKSAVEIAKEEMKKIYLDTVFIETWEIPNAEQLFNFENLENTVKR